MVAVRLRLHVSVTGVTLRVGVRLIMQHSKSTLRSHPLHRVVILPVEPVSAMQVVRIILKTRVQ